MLNPAVAKLPALIINCACYNSLVDAVWGEAATYATRDYAYVMVWQEGRREDIADKVFYRWPADSKAILEWLAKQEWFNGVCGVHGTSLLGSAAYGLVQASLTNDELPRVQCMQPVCSFSRIFPTVYQQGEGLSVELVLRFLWLAEIGTRGEGGRFKGLIGMAKFFGLSDFPGMWKATTTPKALLTADTAMWDRQNELWKGGIVNQSPDSEFWKDGRDKCCNIEQHGEKMPPINITGGFWDIFVIQDIADFVAAREARGTNEGVQITLYSGGHFGVVGKRADKIVRSTLGWYDKFLLGLPDDQLPLGPDDVLGRNVNLEVFGGQGEMHRFDDWPPEGTTDVEYYLQAPPGAGRPRRGGLATDADIATSRPTLVYKYNPADPTPYAGGGWLNLRKEGPMEQRPVERRQDLLVYTSEPITEAFDAVGPVKASIYVSASVKEIDIIVRLCVLRAPRKRDMMDLEGIALGLGFGRSLNVVEAVKRVKFTDKAVVKVDVDVGPTCTRFRKGDCIRIHVCSAAHPRIQRHPLVPTEDCEWCMTAKLGKPAVVSVYADATYPSSITLPVLMGMDMEEGSPMGTAPSIGSDVARPDANLWEKWGARRDADADSDASPTNGAGICVIS